MLPASGQLDPQAHPAGQGASEPNPRQAISRESAQRLVGKNQTQDSSPLRTSNVSVGINQLTTFRSSLTTDLEDYARLRTSNMGLSWKKLVRHGLRRSVAEVQASGIPVSSLGWIGGVTGEHGYSLKEVVSDARKMIRVAAQVEAGCVTVVSGPLAGHIRSHATRVLCELLQELCEFSARFGLNLALQPMHRMYQRKWTFLNNLDDTLSVMDRVNHPNLKLAFGTYHLWEEKNLLQRIQEVAARTQIVSLADWGEAPQHENDRLMPGQGRLPIAEMVNAFQQAGFKGHYELEVWSRDLWELDRREILKQCHSVQKRIRHDVAARETI